MSTREKLIARATELSVFDNPSDHTDSELYWAIKAEESAAAWLARLETLPTDEAKSEAFSRLAESFRVGYPIPHPDRGIS